MKARHLSLWKVIVGPLAIAGCFPLALQAQSAISPATGAPATGVMEDQSNAMAPTGFAATGIHPGVVDITSEDAPESVVTVTETTPTDARGVVPAQVAGIVSGQQPEDDRPAPATFANTGVRQ